VHVDFDDGAALHRSVGLAVVDAPLMAVLYRRDVDLPEGSSAYALFRERITPSLAASGLLS